MTIEDTDKVDMIGSDPAKGIVVLGISDHLDWTDASFHVELLRKKIEAYLEFLLHDLPGRSDMAEYNQKSKIIRVLGKYSRSKEALSAYERIQEKLSAFDVRLEYEDHSSSS